MFNKIRSAVPLIHLYVIVLCIFFQTLTFGEIYRFFACLNLILVLIGIGFYHRKDSIRQTGILAGISLLLLFVMWEWLVSPHFYFAVKPLRHLLLAIGLMAGVALLSAYHDRIKSQLMPLLIGLVYFYTLSQLIATFLMDKPHGTTKNPHYLAIYSAIFFAISICLIIRNSTLLHRILLGLSSFLLGTLLLNTSSRPIWIGVLLAVIMLAFCLRRRTALMLIMASALLFIGLAMTNAGHFKSRWEDLILHANTEERVTIWQDTWQMQKSNSSHLQWIFGHGFDSFETDFTDYSRYHANENIDFNSPHNIVLELLYQFGFVGVVLILSGVAFLYYKIISAYLACRNYYHHAWLYLLLLLILTIDFFSVSIILPFFVGININMLALVIGITLYLNNIEKR